MRRDRLHLAAVAKPQDSGRHDKTSAAPILDISRLVRLVNAHPLAGVVDQNRVCGRPYAGGVCGADPCHIKRSCF